MSSSKQNESTNHGLKDNKIIPQTLMKKERNMAPKTDMVYMDASEEAKSLHNKQETMVSEQEIAAFKQRIIEKFSYKNSELVKKIYKENRAKARASHAKFFHLNHNQKKSTLPLYNQPTELKVYHDNLKRFEVFRPRLLKFLQLKKKAENEMELKTRDSYETNRQLWMKKIEKVENNPKRKQRQQRIRQFYEREFPEIKKHREQQERFERLGSRSVGFVRSEAEMDEITDNLREIDASEKQMRLLAIKAPYLLNSYNRRSKFVNKNGLIRDLDAFEQERKAGIIWTDSERQIYREKYFQHPKDFERIASFLPLKSCRDCVLYYYRNKKKEGFRSSKAKTKKKGKLNRGGTGGTSGNTMQLRMDKQKPKQKEIQETIELDEEEGGDDSIASEEEATLVTVSETSITNSNAQQSATLQVNSDTSTISNNTRTTDKTDSIQTETVAVSTTSSVNVKGKSTPPVKVFNTRSGKYNQRSSQVSQPQNKLDKTVDEIMSTSASSSETNHPPLKMTIMVTSPSHVKDNVNVTSVVSIISETITLSSMVPPEQTNADVSKKSNIAAVDDDQNSSSAITVVDELIKQHLSKMPEHSDPSRWSEQEMKRAIEGLKRHGRCWPLISKLVESKSEAQCKNFYFNYKKKFNLESILGITKKGGASESIDDKEEELIHFLEELEKEEEELEKKKKKEKKHTSAPPCTVAHVSPVTQQAPMVSNTPIVTHATIATSQISNGTESKPIEKPVESQSVFQTPSVIKTTGKEEMRHKDTQHDEDIRKDISTITPKQDIGISSPQPVVSRNSQPVVSRSQQPVVSRSPQAVVSRNSQPVVSQSSQPVVSRLPPPLVSDHPQISKSPKMKEISLKDDVHLFKQKLNLSLDNGNLLLQPAPPLLPADSAQFSPRDDVPPKTPVVLEKFKTSPSDMLNLTQQEQLRTPQSLPNQFAKYMSSPQNLSEQNAAIKAFNTRRPRFMSALPLNTLTPPADASTRFRFPVSPSLPNPSHGHVLSAAQKSAFAYNQLPPKSQSKEIPTAIQINQRSPFHAANPLSPHPPGMKGVSNYKEHEFPNSPVIHPNKGKYSLEEQRRLEYEYYHRKAAAEMEQHTRKQNTPDLFLQREIEAERKAKILQQQKELEIQKIMHHEAQRQEEMQNYMHMKSFEKLANYRLQQENEREQERARIREFEKKKELEMIRQNHPFYSELAHQQQVRVKAMPSHFRERSQPERPSNERSSTQMSDEMKMSLQKLFLPYENIWKHDNLSPTDSSHSLNERVHDFPREYHLDASSRTNSPHPETYLRTYPQQLKPKTFNELQQRAASIPDLRSEIPRSIHDTMHDRKNPKDRARTLSGGEQNPEKRTSIGFPVDHKLREFGKPINIHEIPIEPLSRPGSAESENQSYPEKRVYGISTGLARQTAPLSSISGIPHQVYDYTDHQLSRVNSPQYDVMRSGTPNESEKRKKVIVRPWEIPNTQSNQDLLTRQNVGSPVPNMPHPQFKSGSRQGTPQPVIHLAPTTSKYKKEIINIAQMSSPAPEAFPKFNFDVDSVKENTPSSQVSNTPQQLEDKPQQIRTIRTLSEQSISPTYDFSTQPPFTSSVFTATTTERKTNPTHLPSSAIENIQLSCHSNRTNISANSVSAMSNIKESNSSLLVKRLLSNEVPANSPVNTLVSTSLYVVENPKQFTMSASSNTKIKTVTVFPEAPPSSNTDTLPTIQQVFSLSPRDNSSLGFKEVVTDLSKPVGKTHDSNSTNQPSSCLSATDCTYTTSVTNAPTNSQTISLEEKVTEAFQNESHVTSLQNQESGIKSNRTEDIALQNDASTKLDEKVTTSANNERAESPDIYDDLKVHDYDEQLPDTSLEIFEKSKPNENLSNIVSGKVSPLPTDLDLFCKQSEDTEKEFEIKQSDSVQSNISHSEITTKDKLQTESETGSSDIESNTKSNIHPNDNDDKSSSNDKLGVSPEISERKETGLSHEMSEREEGEIEKEDGEIDDDSDDEELANVTNPSKNPYQLPTISIDKSDTAETNGKVLERQRKEAGTPVLDEPCCKKDSPKKSPHRLHPDSVFDYDRISKRPDERHSSKSRHYESITPPRSPGRRRSQDDKHNSRSPARSTSVAFPYSALAFKVASRTSKTNVSEDKSSRIDDDSRKALRYENSSEHRLPLKRSHFRSSSRDHPSQSPDYDHKMKRHFYRGSPHDASLHYSPRHSPRQSPRYSPRHSPRFSPRHGHSPERKRRKSSSSPDNEAPFRRSHQKY